LIRAKIGESTYVIGTELESHFSSFKKHIIGDDFAYPTVYGTQKLLYADWTASGRLYRKIEDNLVDIIGPYVANTHTESNITGTYITNAYHEAKSIIKNHVHANDDDILIFDGFGMTGVINKFQRLIGIKHMDKRTLTIKERPIVFVTHMEHHSNYLSWLETAAEVITIRPDANGDVDYSHLEELLLLHKQRHMKIGAFTACSNVTGRKTDYHQLAKLMHQYGGICLVDFSASAPYETMNMHPEDKEAFLDVICFSPHKFLGGPGTSGVLIMNKKLIHAKIPDHPGGGTVDFTNGWGDILYKKDLEEREDGGTPGFLQAIRTALAIQLKEEMNVQKMQQREQELVALTMTELSKIPGITILDGENKNRHGIISVICEGLHFDLGAKLLNDRFGIQVRGGCSCAGPYGHYLLGMSKAQSKQISAEIQKGIFTNKPGWIRISLHPTMTNKEVYSIIHAFKKIIMYKEEWQKDYCYMPRSNEYVCALRSNDNHTDIFKSSLK